MQVVRALRFDGTKIPEGYERRVQRALWTFRHQRVYCPQRQRAVHLHEVVGGDLAEGARVPAAAQVRSGLQLGTLECCLQCCLWWWLGLAAFCSQAHHIHTPGLHVAGAGQ